MRNQAFVKKYEKIYQSIENNRKKESQNYETDLAKC